MNSSLGIGRCVAPWWNTLSTTVGGVQPWSSPGQFAEPPPVAAVTGATGSWRYSTDLATGASSAVGLVLVPLSTLAPSNPS